MIKDRIVKVRFVVFIIGVFWYFIMILSINNVRIKFRLYVFSRIIVINFLKFIMVSGFFI